MGTQSLAAAYLLLSICYISSDTDSQPTASSLGQWLAGKEVVEVRFDGPRMELQRLRKAIHTKVNDAESDFRLTPGTGGDSQGSFVEICLEATPANVERLLAIQQELKAVGFRLNPAKCRVWSYPANGLTQARAETVLVECRTATKLALEMIPDVVCKSNGGELRYGKPGKHFHGIVLFSDVTAAKPWTSQYASYMPDQTLHLPHLGLMVVSFLPASFRVDGKLAQREQVRKIFKESVLPLLKLEPGSEVYSTPTLAPRQEFDISH